MENEENLVLIETIKKEIQKSSIRQNQIAGAIVVAGLLIAGAILLGGGSNTPVDPVKAEAKLTKSLPIFSSCLDSGKYAQAVSDSTEAGNKAGVNGTPKGFILF